MHLFPEKDLNLPLIILFSLLNLGLFILLIPYVRLPEEERSFSHFLSFFKENALALLRLQHRICYRLSLSLLPYLALGVLITHFLDQFIEVPENLEKPSFFFGIFIILIGIRLGMRTSFRLQFASEALIFNKKGEDPLFSSEHILQGSFKLSLLALLLRLAFLGSFITLFYFFLLKKPFLFILANFFLLSLAQTFKLEVFLHLKNKKDEEALLDF